MEAYIPSLYSDDRDIEIFFREAALSVHKAENAILMVESVYLEADEDAEKKGFFGKVVQSIKNFIAKVMSVIRDFIGAIQTTFGSKLSVDVYMNSNTVEVKLNEDIEKATRQIEDQILSERKGVQAISAMVKKISSVTGKPIDMFIDDRAIGAAIDKVNNFAVTKGGTILKAGVATVIANRLHKSISESLNLSKQLDDLTNEVEKRKDAVHDKMIAQYEKNGNTILKYIEQATHCVEKTSAKAMKYYTELTKPINDFKRNLRK